MILTMWKNKKNDGKEDIDDLIRALRLGQNANGVQPLIVVLEKLVKK